MFSLSLSEEKSIFQLFMNMFLYNQWKINLETKKIEYITERTGSKIIEKVRIAENVRRQRNVPFTATASPLIKFWFATLLAHGRH